MTTVCGPTRRPVWRTSDKSKCTTARVVFSAEMGYSATERGVVANLRVLLRCVKVLFQPGKVLAPSANCLCELAESCFGREKYFSSREKRSRIRPTPFAARNRAHTVRQTTSPARKSGFSGRKSTRAGRWNARNPCNNKGLKRKPACEKGNDPDFCVLCVSCVKKRHHQGKEMQEAALRRGNESLH